MFEITDKFEVIEKKNFDGLTIGSFVRKPGYKFTFSEWPYTLKMLEAALKENRVKKISGKGSEEKDKNKKALEKMRENYSAMDGNSEKAEKLFEKIKKLEAEI